MEIGDLVKDANTLQTFMEKVKKAKLKLSIAEIGRVEIEIVKPQTDYALVKTHIPRDIVGTSTLLVLPYSSPRVGYILAE